MKGVKATINCICKGVNNLGGVSCHATYQETTSLHGKPDASARTSKSEFLARWDCTMYRFSLGFMNFLPNFPVFLLFAGASALAVSAPSTFVEDFSITSSPPSPSLSKPLEEVEKGQEDEEDGGQGQELRKILTRHVFLLLYPVLTFAALHADEMK